MLQRPFVALSLAMVALTALGLALLFTTPGLSADDGANPTAAGRRELTYPNLGSRLDAVVASYQQGRQSESRAARHGAVHQDNSIAVTIYLSGNVAAVANFLIDNGASVRNVGEDYIEAYVPVSLLGQASQQTGVTRVREIIPPRPMYGNVTSQGVSLHFAPAWHNNGYQGGGVKVGIIDAGFEDWQSLQGVELPRTTAGVRCYTSQGTYTSNLSHCDSDEHGTAVGETITDVAPEATLYLAKPWTKGDLRSIVNWMASQGVQVINMSLGWFFDGPGDGTSASSNSPLNSVGSAVTSGIIWVNSAGNDAKSTWYGAFADSDDDDLHEWEGADERQSYSFDANDDVTLQLRWDDSWGGADTDLDLEMYRDSDDTLVASSTDRQNGGTNDVPFEYITGTVTQSGDYYFVVKHVSGAAPAWLQLTEWNMGDLEHYTERGSMTNPAESANSGMLAVGATHYWDTTTIADYSSQGPAPDGRVKPDITGVDCGQVKSYSKYTRGSNDAWFCGTSQASPHVAGLAALVRQANPSFTPVQTASYLKTNAVDRGDVGPDNVWGSGFALMPAAPTATCDQSLTSDGTIDGSWVSGCQSQVSGRGYAEYYSFTLSEEKIVTITLNSGTNPYLYLRSGSAKSGAALAENDNHNGSATRSQISQTLGAGSYTIEATTNSPAQSGRFTLTLARRSASSPPPATPTPTPTPLPTPVQANNCTTEELTADGATAGTWAAACQSQVSGRGYAKYYTFTLSEQKTITITLDSTTNPYLYLRSGDAQAGATVAENDNHNGDATKSQISQSLAAGSYTIEATTNSPAQAGEFTLTLAGLDSGGTPPPQPTDPCADALTTDGANTGAWADDCVSQVASPDTNDAADARSYARYYAFTLSEQKTVTITLESGDTPKVDTYLYLRAGDAKSGVPVAENDDIEAGVNFDSRVEETLAAGSYTVEATTYKAAQAGNFTLTIAGLDSDGGGGSDACPATTLTADGASTGAWASDCLSQVASPDPTDASPDPTDASDARSYASYFVFTAKEDEVTITLESAQDTYLYLREGDNTHTGAAVAENDDIDTAAQNYNSRITATLTAGATYSIEATTYRAATAGSFTLTIAGLGTAPPPACTVNRVLAPGQSFAHSAAGLVVFTATVESNGELSLRFSGTTAPLSGLFFTRNGNNWTITGLP